MANKYEFVINEYQSFDLNKVLKSEIWHNFEKEYPDDVNLALYELSNFNIWCYDRHTFELTYNEDIRVNENKTVTFRSNYVSRMFTMEDAFYSPNCELPIIEHFNSNFALSEKADDYYYALVPSKIRYTIGRFDDDYIIAKLYKSLGFDLYMTICKKLKGGTDKYYSPISCLFDKYDEKIYNKKSDDVDIKVISIVVPLCDKSN
jgi:hypothetical protein